MSDDALTPTQTEHAAPDDTGPLPPPPPDIGVGSRRDRRRTGLILIVIAATFGAAQVLDLNVLMLLLLPGLGLAFYALGAFRREPGAIVAGGVLLGIGAGILVVSTDRLAGLLGGSRSGGGFLLAFALGWVSITVGTALFTKETYWWALIPAAVMALAGLGVSGFAWSMSLLSLLERTWWIALLALGLYLVFKDRSET